MAFNTNDLDKSFESFSVEGFRFRKEVMGYSWSIENSDRIEKIIIGYGGYPDSFRIYTPVVETSFHEVEFLLERVYKQSKVQGLYNHTTIHQSLINIVGVNYQLFETEINNDDTFNLVASEIKKMIQNGAIPFFKKYQTLNAVFEYTEKMPIEQMSNFIGQPLPFRRLIIKKLCNDSTYEEYYKLIIDFYRAEGAKEEVKLAEQLHLNLSSQS